MGLKRFLTDPDVGQYLNRDDDEVVVWHERKHVAAQVVPGLLVLAGLVLLVSTAVVPAEISAVPLLLGLLVGCYGGVRMWRVHMDRFVITDTKVFRVHGILNRRYASMPLTKILDVSMSRPLPGLVLRYGHFTFESAAQEQGLREISFVRRPVECDQTIQRVVQRAGLRGRRTSETEQPVRLRP